MWAQVRARLQQRADMEAHELPQYGKQQLVLPVYYVDAPNIHQRQAQHSPSDVHRLRLHIFANPFQRQSTSQPSHARPKKPL